MITEIDIARDQWYDDTIDLIKLHINYNSNIAIEHIAELIKEGFDIKQMAIDIFESDEEIYLNIFEIIDKVLNA